MRKTMFRSFEGRRYRMFAPSKSRCLRGLTLLLTLSAAIAASTSYGADFTFEDWRPSAARDAGTVQTLAVDGVAFQFRWIPGGSLTTSDGVDPNNRSGGDRRDVFVRGFWLLETEVTQRMWVSIVGTNHSGFSSKGYAFARVQGRSTDALPVENVSWNEARDFVAQLNRKTAPPKELQFRLPTEAEWEYACRAGEDRAYAGSDRLDDVGWFFDNGDCRTHRVGTKAANRWGLRDMCGNVMEWVQDLSGEDRFSARTRDPQRNGDGKRRVARGGGWNSPAEECGADARDCYEPEYRDYDLGFRIALAETE